MGNRAVIAFKSEQFEKDQSPAIYLHWNGGRDSVEAFLRAGERLGIRGNDPTYCMARLTQVIGNYLGGTLSLGVGCYGNFRDPGDNGVYWIKNWEIVERETWTGGSENSEGLIEREGKLFEEQNGYDIESLADTVFEANKESMNPFDKVEIILDASVLKEEGLA